MIEHPLVFLIGQSMILMIMEEVEEQTIVGTANEESNETAILPSHDDQGNFCGGVGHVVS